MSGSFDPDEVLARIDAGEYLDREEQVARLSVEARSAAAFLVDRNLEAVRATVVALAPKEPICGICLVPMHDSEVEEFERTTGREVNWPLNVRMVALDTPAKRAERAPAGRVRDEMVSVWLAHDWWWEADIDLGVRTPEFTRAESVFEKAAWAVKGVPRGERGEVALMQWAYWWWGWIFGRVAEALTRDPPVAVTDDFVAYYQDYDFGPLPSLLLPLLATERAAGLLREQGFLGPA